MTQKTEQIFLVQYGGSREFKQPDNLSRTSEVQAKRVGLVSREIESEEEVGEEVVMDEFEQTPIHRYGGGGKRQVPGDSSQVSDADESSRQQLQRTKVVLQFKINELQKICSTLTSANSKLLDKIEELQVQNERLKERIGQGFEREINSNEDNKNNNSNNDNDNQSSNNDYQSSDAQQSSIIIFDANTNNANNQQLPSISSQQLQQQQTSNNLISYQNESNFQNEVSDIQQMIVQYRQQLKKAQQLNRNNKLYYEGRIKELEESVSGLREEVESYGMLNGELEGRLWELEERNSMFEDEIEQLQQEAVTVPVISHATNPSYRQNHPIVANIKHHNPINVIDNNTTTTPRSSFYSPYNPKRSAYNSTSSVLDDDYLYSQSISSTLQLQLQKLIEKLVRQLQTQRVTKGKMGQQLKRIQSQLLQSQKMLSQKNQRIYQLQMQVLGYQKTNMIMANNSNNNINSNIIINKPTALRTTTTPATTTAVLNNTTTNIIANKSHYVLNHGNTNTNTNTNTRLFSSNISNNNSNTNNISSTNVNVNVNGVGNTTSSPRVNRQVFSRKEYVTSSVGSNAVGNSLNNNNLNDGNVNNKEVAVQRNSGQNRNVKNEGEQKSQQQQQQANNSNIAKNALNRQPTQKQLQPLTSSTNPTTTFTLSKHPRQQQPPTSAVGNPPQKKLLQTCTLMQLLHDPNINLSQKQKLLISLKLILFYEQKIYKQRNYTLLGLQNILVTNFNQINLRLIIIRASAVSDTQCYQADRVERMVENLAFLLNSVLIDVSNGKVSYEGVLESCTMLRDKIQCILSGERVKEGDVGELRAMVEAALE